MFIWSRSSGSPSKACCSPAAQFADPKVSCLMGPQQGWGCSYVAVHVEDLQFDSRPTKAKVLARNFQILVFQTGCCIPFRGLMSGSSPQMSVASNVIPKLPVLKQEGSVTRTLGQEDGSNMMKGRKWGSGDAQGWQDCCGNQEGVNPALGHHGSNPCGEQGCVLPAISVNQPMSGHPSVKCKGLVSCLTSQQGGHIEFDLRGGLWGKLASQLRVSPCKAIRPIRAGRRQHQTRL